MKFLFLGFGILIYKLEGLGCLLLPVFCFFPLRLLSLAFDVFIRSELNSLFPFIPFQKPQKSRETELACDHSTLNSQNRTGLPNEL